MAKYNFNEDIKIGLSAELYVKCQLFNLLGPDYEYEFNNTKSYDILIRKSDKPVVTLEVKYDIMAKKTGNVAIEIESRGNPSGIEVTDADWWCQIIDVTPWFIQTERLKQLILQHGKLVVGGDAGSETKMYLVPDEIFRGFACEREDFVKAIS